MRAAEPQVASLELTECKWRAVALRQPWQTTFLELQQRVLNTSTDSISGRREGQEHPVDGGDKARPVYRHHFELSAMPKASGVRDALE